MSAMFEIETDPPKIPIASLEILKEKKKKKTKTNTTLCQVKMMT